MWILWKMRFWKCDFSDKLRIFVPVCECKQIFTVFFLVSRGWKETVPRRTAPIWNETSAAIGRIPSFFGHCHQRIRTIAKRETQNADGARDAKVAWFGRRVWPRITGMEGPTQTSQTSKFSWEYLNFHAQNLRSTLVENKSHFVHKAIPRGIDCRRNRASQILPSYSWPQKLFKTIHPTQVDF